MNIFLKIEISPSLKIVKSEIVTGKPAALEEPQDQCVKDLVELVQRYVHGQADVNEVLPYLQLPRNNALIMLAVLSIPRGKVASYLQIANIVGTHPRVVGRAVASNPLPVLVPCHRVVHNDGRLGGYSMSNPELKKVLLQLEGVEISSTGRVSRNSFVKEENLREKFFRILEAYRNLPERTVKL